jgi:hypothetical protein
MTQIIERMKNEFEVKTGDPNCFVGLELKREGAVIKISQKTYIKRVLERFNMDQSTLAPTPGEVSIKLTKEMSKKSRPTKRNERSPLQTSSGFIDVCSTYARPDILYEVCAIQ